MPRSLPDTLPAAAAGKTAVLLINLGTPAAPTPAAVRSYLKEFLSDPRVIEIPKAIWWPILNLVILRVRPKKSAAKYATVWTDEGSPLQVHSARQARLLRGFLGHAGIDVVVDHAMRYGEPSIGATLSRLQTEGCTRILLLPLYPQYSASTSASSFDAAFAWAARMRNQPELRTLRSFAADPAYIAALAASVREHWRVNPRPSGGYRLVLSFHGMPRASFEKGDPYYLECRQTGELLAAALGLEADEYRICFQSRFGFAEWLKPYTAASLEEFGKAGGVGRVNILCPGFPADCLETLREIAIEGKATFLEAGGREYHYIACLNERDDWIRALAGLAANALQGWPTRAADAGDAAPAAAGYARAALPD